eukprot:5598347-Prymnesium_polylepis.1
MGETNCMRHHCGYLPSVKSSTAAKDEASKELCKTSLVPTETKYTFWPSPVAELAAERRRAFSVVVRVQRDSFVSGLGGPAAIEFWERDRNVWANGV